MLTACCPTALQPAAASAHLTAAQGEFGPFQPNRECAVPLWLAHTLWKRKRAAIRPPPWMDVEHLDAVLGLERQDASAFQPLPFHYIEVAHFLFTSGTDGNLPQEVFGDDLARVRARLAVAGCGLRVCFRVGLEGGAEATRGRRAGLPAVQTSLSCCAAPA